MNGVIHYVGGYADHVIDSVKVEHITAGGLHVATPVVGGLKAGTYFTHGDHLGSLTVLMGHAASLVGLCRPDASI